MTWPFLLALATGGGAGDGAGTRSDEPAADADDAGQRGGEDGRSGDAARGGAGRTDPERRTDGDRRADEARREGGRPASAASRPPRPARPGRKTELDAQVAEAQRKLREAIEKNQAAQPRRPPQVGQKVDKYFGEKLPPVCERLGCYLTDDGKRFYCVNQTCQKHRKRATKHTKVAKKSRDRPSYFRCPRCDSQHVDLLMFTDQYECRRCGHTWEREPPDAARGQP